MGIKKRMVWLLTASVTLVSTMLSITSDVFAINEQVAVLYPTGSVYSSTEELLSPGIDESDDVQLYSLSSSHDITTNSQTAKFFPEIGNQGNMGSCTAFATTYYQFTYEVNRLRNIETTSSNTYSPSWTYNYLNGGQNVGTNCRKAYNILYSQGALTLETMPYNGNSSQYSYEWSSNVPKMLEALHYRANVDEVPYTTNHYLNIQKLKEKIRSGHPIVAHTYAYGWDILSNSDNEKVIVRSHEAGGGHMVTIVGYDDDFQVTVNGVTMEGAFKIANSWGDTWGNDGYIWVLYDALRETSAYSGWESTYSTTRDEMFPYHEFYFMEPFYSYSQICEVIRYTSTYPWSIHVSAQRSTGEYIPRAGYGASNQYSATAKTRYLVFDYHSFGGSFNINSILSSQWTFKMEGNTTPQSTTYILARLVDDLNQDIDPSDPFGYNYVGMANGQLIKTHNTSFAFGRISSYDSGPLEPSDTMLLEDYLDGYVELSSLQQELADYNRDGKIDQSDLTAMEQAIAS